MVSTHVWSTNGRANTELRAWDQNPERELADLLSRLNGTDRYSFLIWRLPEGRGLFDVEPDDPARRQYMQCAGDFNGRMTCEVRELVDGEPHQYVLGRSADTAADPRRASDQVVPWNKHEAKVRPNEVLTGSEVAGLFVHYYRTGNSAPGYSRRELNL